MTEVVQPTADEALAWLKAGNERFAAGRSMGHDSREERRAVRMEQHPYAVLLCCSDSRVPPELIFDETLGRLFVVRVAGNVVTQVELGSIEFAVDHLKVALIVVMGHERCGAVTAAVNGGHMSRHMRAIVTHIKPAVDEAHQRVPTTNDPEAQERLVNHAVEANVHNQMNHMHRDDVLERYLQSGQVRIAGGVYNLSTGRVDWLTPQT